MTLNVNVRFLQDKLARNVNKAMVNAGSQPYKIGSSTNVLCKSFILTSSHFESTTTVFSVAIDARLRFAGLPATLEILENPEKPCISISIL